jgi:hypothetical protein
MKILTTATYSEGYFTLLKQTAEDLKYQLSVLGWRQPWKGFAWKIELYAQELKTIAPDEIVICVDAYDVVVVGPPGEILAKFKEINHPIAFSGQRYFPGQSWMRILADKLMSDNHDQYIKNRIDDPYDYSRPCMGLLIGYAGKLLELFNALLEIEKEESINNDQILLNKYYLKNPDSIFLDSSCTMFQNLWRTGWGLFGKINPHNSRCEIDIYFDEQYKRKRVRNKKFNTTACFIHGPFNLDMSLVIKELDLKAPPLDLYKSWHYWEYSIMYFLKRGIRFFCRWVFGILLLIIVGVILIYHFLL